jgi:ABC-type transport system involved in cytochrome bd biosynthesis fused ATPase/permease subunit
MKTNIGTADKVIRIIVAIALILNGIISGTVAIILLVLSGIFIVTSLISFCPLYLPFGISTKKKEK